MLANSEFWLIMNEQGNVMATGDPAQDADGRFPNRELAEMAAMNLAQSRQGSDLYVAKATRTVVSIFQSKTTVEVRTPDEASA